MAPYKLSFYYYLFIIINCVILHVTKLWLR